MSKRASMACGAALAAVLAVLLAPQSAAAQPDPFADYDRWKEGEPVEPQAPPGAGEEEEFSGPWEGFRKGVIGVGGRLQLAYTGTDNEVLEGVDESNNSFFFRLTPTVTYTVIDRVHLALSLGVLSKSVSQEAGQDSDETNFFTEAQVYYHIPLGARSRFSFVPGIGLGFYIGSGSRDLTITKDGEASVVEESTTTSGFTAAVYLGLGYALSPRWQIRSGLALNAFLGSESIDSSDASLATSAAHIGLPLELYYAF
jgi:hypothetical protein